MKKNTATRAFLSLPLTTIKIVSFVLNFCFLLVLPIFGHDPGLSSADFKLEQNQLSAQLALNYVDIAALVPVDQNADQVISPAELAAAQPQLEALAKAALEISSDGKIIAPQTVLVRIAKAEDGRENAFFSLSFPALPSNSLSIRFALLDKLPRGHRTYFKLASADGKMIAERLLDANNSSANVSAGELAAALGKWHTFKQFLLLGIEHILLGFDHLCFLFALLLVAENVMGVLKIVTAFTLAHSITLALAALDIVNISPGIVEPMIAVSIVYVGLENIWRSGKKIEGRWLLTFAFGLIHGFGFASVLKELNIGAAGSSIAVPLVSFNLGVEIGQLAIAGLLFPIIVFLKKRPTFQLRLVPVCSMLVAIAGGYWLIERTMLK